MAKVKLQKLPKRPKASASIKIKEAYLRKVEAIRKKNAEKLKNASYSEQLDKKIAGVIEGYRRSCR